MEYDNKLDKGKPTFDYGKQTVIYGKLTFYNIGKLKTNIGQRKPTPWDNKTKMKMTWGVYVGGLVGRKGRLTNQRPQTDPVI